MERIDVEIEFPDIYKKEEIINAIFSQVDIDALKECGIKILVSKDINWFK